MGGVGEGEGQKRMEWGSLDGEPMEVRDARMTSEQRP